MAESVDYLIVGTGLTGSTLARLLTDAGYEVLMLDRREHLGGNVFDEVHKDSGIRFHTYGPHLFRTNSVGLWNFMHRFVDFYDYFHRVSTFIDGELEAWPITESYLHRIAGKNWKPDFEGTPANFEEASLSMMPRVVYEKFVHAYTQKQWGVDPKTLDGALAKRFDVRKDDDRQFSPHKFQGLPVGGYAALMKSVLKGIDVRIGVDYLQCRDDFHVRKRLIFTGPIDEFYNFEYGQLTYRSQKRDKEYLPHVEEFQPGSQVNYPSSDDAAFVRRLEWKWMMDPNELVGTNGTLLTTETPFTPTNPNQFEYPFPDKKNAEHYQQYRKRAEADEKVLICGRLGEYRYFDMDQAIGRAFMLAKREFGLDVSFLDDDAASAIV